MQPDRAAGCLASSTEGVRRAGSAASRDAAEDIRIHFASACPDAALFRLLAGRLAASGP